MLPHGRFVIESRGAGVDHRGSTGQTTGSLVVVGVGPDTAQGLHGILHCFALGVMTTAAAASRFGALTRAFEDIACGSRRHLALGRWLRAQVFLEVIVLSEGGLLWLSESLVAMLPDHGSLRNCNGANGQMAFLSFVFSQWRLRRVCRLKLLRLIGLALIFFLHLFFLLLELEFVHDSLCIFDVQAFFDYLQIHFANIFTSFYFLVDIMLEFLFVFKQGCRLFLLG